MTLIGQHTEIHWDTEAVKERYRMAIRVGIDRTLTAAVIRARDDHEYLDDTGMMTAGIALIEPAHESGPGSWTGVWGSRTNYSLYLEVGTSRPWSGAPRAQDRAALGHGDMWAIPGPMPFPPPHTNTRWVQSQGERTKIPGDGPLMEARMWARPAAQMEYRLLGDRIAAAYRGEVLP